MIDDNTKRLAIFVLSRTGTAQAVLDGMGDEFVKELAALIDAKSGALVPSVFEKARLVLVRHYDSLKASKVELEPLWTPEQEQAYKQAAADSTDSTTDREATPPAEE